MRKDVSIFQLMLENYSEQLNESQYFNTETQERNCKDVTEDEKTDKKELTD